MELYKKYPKLTVLWCCVEIILYPGQLYGWSSLQYVLKQEGFYSDLCELENKNETLLMPEDIIGSNTTTSSNSSLVLTYSEVRKAKAHLHRGVQKFRSAITHRY